MAWEHNARTTSPMKRPLTFVLLAASLPCIAQDTTRSKLEHTVYFELLGTGGIYSLNYELRHGHLAVRAGGEAVGMSSKANTVNTIWAVPLEILVLTTPHADRTAEFGIGYTPTFGPRSYTVNEGLRLPDVEVPYTYDAFPSLQIGYRSAPKDRRYIFRFDLTVLHLSKVYDNKGNHTSPRTQLWGGFCFGHVFRRP